MATIPFNPATYPAQRRGGEGPEAAASAGLVSSVFGRIGAVLAVLGDYSASLVTNNSTVVGATVADALDWLASHAGAVTSVATRVGVITAAQLSGSGLEPNTGLDALQVATTLPARGQENVAVDAWPSLQTQGSIANLASLTLTIPLAAVTRFQAIQTVAYVDSGDGVGTCIFAQCLLNVVHRLTAGTGVLIVDDQIQWQQTAVNWTFSTAIVGTDLVCTLSNASGTARPGSIVAAILSQDKP